MYRRNIRPRKLRQYRAPARAPNAPNAPDASPNSLGMPDECVLANIRTEMETMLWPSWSERHQAFYRVLIDIVAKNRDRYINYNNNKSEIQKICENIRIQPWFKVMPLATGRRLLAAASSLEVITNTEDRLVLRSGLAYLAADISGGLAIYWTTVPQDMETAAPGYYSVAQLTCKIKEADEGAQPDIHGLRRLFTGILNLNITDAQILMFTREVLLFFDVHLELSL